MDSESESLTNRILLLTNYFHNYQGNNIQIIMHVSNPP